MQPGAATVLPCTEVSPILETFFVEVEELTTDVSALSEAATLSASP